MMDKKVDSFFAVTAPGLEVFTALELGRLGLLPEAFVAAKGEGGVPFEGDTRALQRANLQLRTASRVLVRLGAFYAASFSELRAKAARLGWDRTLAPGALLAHQAKSIEGDVVEASEASRMAVVR